MTTRHLTLSLLAAAGLGGAALSTHAAVYLSEDFEGYNAGDLTSQSSWTTAASASLQVSTDHAAGGSNSALAQAITGGSGNNAGERNLIQFEAIGTPTANNRVVFSFDFLDTSPSADPYKQFATIQSPVPQGGAYIVYLGLDSSLTSADQGGNYYMAGIRNHDDHAMFKLNEGGAITRTDDWVNLKVEISDTEFRFYVNDVLAKTVATTLAAANTYDRVRIGSGVGDPGADAYYDNITVYTIPEPATWSAILAGSALLAVLGARRLRKRENLE